MSRKTSPVLVTQALWELLRYELIIGIFGFRRIHDPLSHLRSAEVTPLPNVQDAICEAMAWALSLYAKRVRCLQRAAATTRLLRRYGMRAELVIGYRSVPFFGHAWVETEGRIVSDSQEYKRRLYVLERI